MPPFDLSNDAWTEVVAAGGSSAQQITVTLGEALVSIGAPDALKAAVKIGGASGRSLTDGRTLVVEAGIAVSARPVASWARLTVGSAVLTAPLGLGILGLGIMGVNGLGAIGLGA